MLNVGNPMDMFIFNLSVPNPKIEKYHDYLLEYEDSEDSQDEGKDQVSNYVALGVSLLTDSCPCK